MMSLALRTELAFNSFIYRIFRREVVVELTRIELATS